MRLQQIGEFGLIEKIKGKVAVTDERVVLGIGDDAAAFKTITGKLLLLTTDSLVEGIHFDLEYTTFCQVGWKAMVANISDIAAMGGIPTAAAVSLCLPGGIRVESVEELYTGMGEVGERYGVSIIGGDTTASPSGLMVSVAMVGEVEPDKLVTRARAKAGDAICVTGELGGAVAGLKVLKARKPGTLAGLQRWSPAVAKHLVPTPRVKEARVLVERAAINSMIDISDGLASEINHICRASGVGAEIFVDKIPVFPPSEEVAQNLGESALDYVLSGGEDFELLFTLSPGEAVKLLKGMLEETGTKVTVIGSTLEAEEGTYLVDFNGQKKPLPSEGYDHFQFTADKPKE